MRLRLPVEALEQREEHDDEAFAETRKVAGEADDQFDRSKPANAHQPAPVT